VINLSRRGTKTITVPEEEHKKIKQNAEEHGMEIKDYVLEKCIPDGVENIQIPEKDHEVISGLAEKNGLDIGDFVLAVCRERFPDAFPIKLLA
jgi:cupin superfamily acireductone dioxygenase involved in methionine salvage